MKKILLIVCFFISGVMVNAQKKLSIKSGDKGLYLEHRVAAKENFYSIGYARLFAAVNPSEPGPFFF